MTIIQFLYLYLLTIPIFLVIDLLWIGVVANKFYQSQIGYLLGPVNWAGAIVFYLIYVFGIIFFVVNPALSSGSIFKAMFLGALFGFIAYATYDLTNQATIKDWPVLMSVVDIIWGAVFTGTVATVSYYVAKTFIL